MDHTVSIRSTLEKSSNKSESSKSSSTGEADVVKKLTQLRKKVDNLDESIQKKLAIVANEVFLQSYHPFHYFVETQLTND